MVFKLKDDEIGSESDQYCIPFVSEYTDCTEENRCSGCSKCTCSADGKWNCDTITECPGEEVDLANIDDNDIDLALEILQKELKNKEMRDKVASNNPLVPEPEGKDDLLLELRETNMEDEILSLMRSKRSISNQGQGGDKLNETDQFRHMIDEINEDTLQNSNVSGTITAKKMDTLPQITRRAGNNTSNSLQILYTKPKEYNHRDDNKVDTPAIHDDKEDLLAHSNIYNVIGNNSQTARDKELSKIVVNELKKGTETIGDEKAPVISNITFTAANDTLTSMVFIAGNLLNKLWNIEKVDNGDTETELLKHEKITDLLDLFKEPLQLRQEMFLKDALEQLKTALNENKNIENISLCKNIKVVQGKSAKKIFHRENNEGKSDCTDKKNTQINPKTSTVEALNKLTNILDLIQRLENIQNTLSNLKSGNKNDNRKFNADFEPTTNTNLSLDLYGKILETITKLLIPNQKSKKLIKSIHNRYMFTAGQDVKSELKLGDLNVTTKDRIVMDYLAHIQSNPNCLLKKNDYVAHSSVEGNILLNLSEFFKIKSLSDLMRIADIDKRPMLKSKDVASKNTVVRQAKNVINKTEDKGPKQLNKTKEKLREHLKFIIEDLMDIQNTEGKLAKDKDVQIMDILPCIYNIMNTGQEKNKRNSSNIAPLAHGKRTNTDTPRKLRIIFDDLKKELKLTQTRRANTLHGPRPKSAIVWERLIKNVNVKTKNNTRRAFDEPPVSVEELKAIMNKIDSAGSNTYKNYAYLYEVLPAERLLLLKTFNADTLRIIKALEKIYIVLQSNLKVPYDSFKDLSEFTDNVATNIKLNEKVVNNIDRTKDMKKAISALYPERKPLLHTKKSYDSKLSRDQVINQIIKNRVLLYVQTKEATRETKNDINYAIATKILFHLEMGNYALAKELYRIFASLRQKDVTNVENINHGIAKVYNPQYISHNTKVQVEPLIKFEDPKSTNKGLDARNLDNVIKQLLNLKNM